MFTELRRFGWREQFDAGPVGTYEYIRDVLGVDDEQLEEMAAWEEVPAPIREAILVCCLAERNTGRPISAEAAAAIAQHHRVPLNPVLMALGWMAPSTMQFTELECTVLRLVAAMDKVQRAPH
jgi:hypothetical protein